MRIDLHVHSSRSDGTDAPAALVAKAAAAGLDVVALTDHDTVSGWDEARAAADRHGIGLVLGVEVSCRLAGAGVHLLAYLVDPTHERLDAELRRIRDSRDSRVPQIVERLHAVGIPLEVHHVTDAARAAAAPGRPHVADALVAQGHAADRAEALDRWLAEGRPAHVAKYAPEVRSAIALVRQAGGVPVLAHGRGRSSRGVVTDDAVTELAAAGLAGLEVDHHDHDEPTRRELRLLAERLGLIVTGSSDHHGSGKVGHALGSETTAPRQYAELVRAAEEQAARTGRTTPMAPPAVRTHR